MLLDPEYSLVKFLGFSFNVERRSPKFGDQLEIFGISSSYPEDLDFFGYASVRIKPPWIW